MRRLAFSNSPLDQRLLLTRLIDENTIVSKVNKEPVHVRRPLGRPNVPWLIVKLCITLARDFVEVYRSLIPGHQHERFTIEAPRVKIAIPPKTFSTGNLKKVVLSRDLATAMKKFRLPAVGAHMPFPR